MTLPSLLRSLCCLILALAAVAGQDDPIDRPLRQAHDGPLIQLAILLDDSGSMNGLINQARAHIWDVVHQLGQTTKDGRRPRLEVALYHYGDTPFLHKPLLPFSDDLDVVSRTLFAINGGGGEERCGEVIRNAVQQLAWSRDPTHLRMIVIAGNEPFTQGPVDYPQAIALARAKDIVISTIHCGSEAQGIAGNWADGASLGGGTFHNIDHNQRSFDVPAPQDARIRELNTGLNDTYLPYGAQGLARAQEQVAQDTNADRLGSGSFASRAQVKSGAVYSNERWDLVDAVRANEAILESVTEDQLPAALQGRTRAEIEAAVAEAAARRAGIQQELDALVRERQAYIAAEQARLAGEAGASTLGDAMSASVRQLAEGKGYATSAGTEEIQP